VQLYVHVLRQVGKAAQMGYGEASKLLRAVFPAVVNTLSRHLRLGSAETKVGGTEAEGGTVVGGTGGKVVLGQLPRTFLWPASKAPQQLGSIDSPASSQPHPHLTSTPLPVSLSPTVCCSDRRVTCAAGAAVSGA
jgi:hypothetical protein